ncbi:hypothetical protein CEXT_696311 [Caerostris extrusa]|uniref:Uncharacterized protein n=1 Tax=Caerostris extrusa TaxID=172846 RepID=A0AAV4YEW0_CAEEX|nr:hypothetical protein CEXT_696311 [Caerostris extrusa]
MTKHPCRRFFETQAVLERFDGLRLPVFLPSTFAAKGKRELHKVLTGCSILKTIRGRGWRLRYFVSHTHQPGNFSNRSVLLYLVEHN